MQTTILSENLQFKTL